MVHRSNNADHAGERAQSSFWGESQQGGSVYVPRKETKQSRAKRVKKAILSFDEQFGNTSPAQKPAQGGQSDSPSNGTTRTAEHDGSYNGPGMTAELNCVGHQFQDYGRQ